MSKISSSIEKKLMKKHYNNVKDICYLLNIAYVIDSCYICCEDYKGRIHEFYLLDSNNEKVIDVVIKYDNNKDVLIVEKI